METKIKCFLALGFIMGLGALYTYNNDSTDYNINQNVYSSYEQCMQDWGGSVQDAKQNGFDDVCQISNDSSLDLTNNQVNSGTNTVIIHDSTPMVHTYYTGPRYYSLPNGQVRTFFKKDGKTFLGTETNPSPKVGKVVD